MTFPTARSKRNQAGCAQFLRQTTGIALQTSPIGGWTGRNEELCPRIGHWTGSFVVRTCSFAKRTTSFGVLTCRIADSTSRFGDWTCSIDDWTCRFADLKLKMSCFWNPIADPACPDGKSVRQPADSGGQMRNSGRPVGDSGRPTRDFPRPARDAGGPAIDSARPPGDFGRPVADPGGLEGDVPKTGKSCPQDFCHIRSVHLVLKRSELPFFIQAKLRAHF